MENYLDVSGNIMALSIDVNSLYERQFFQTFKDCKNIRSVKNLVLPIGELKQSCY
jgi:hypothetical protein